MGLAALGVHGAVPRGIHAPRALRPGNPYLRRAAHAAGPALPSNDPFESGYGTLDAIRAAEKVLIPVDYFHNLRYISPTSVHGGACTRSPSNCGRRPARSTG